MPMINFWKKRTQDSEGGAPLTWSKEAKKALAQSVEQAPVPSLLKNRMKKELEASAEKMARANGHTEVTAEDLMQGLMEKLPADMKKQVEQAMRQGPEGLKALTRRLGNKG